MKVFLAIILAILAIILIGIFQALVDLACYEFGLWFIIPFFGGAFALIVYFFKDFL